MLIVSWNSLCKSTYHQKQDPVTSWLATPTGIRYESWFQRCDWDGNHLHYFSLPSILTAEVTLRISIVIDFG